MKSNSGEVITVQKRQCFGDYAADMANFALLLTLAV